MAAAKIKPLSLECYQKALASSDPKINYPKVYASVLYWLEKKKEGTAKVKNGNQ